MKLTYKELAESADGVMPGGEPVPGAFTRFRQLAKPIKTAQRMLGITREFRQHYQDFRELVSDLQNTHGTLSEDETQYTFDGEAAKAFNEGYAALLNTVIEISGNRLTFRTLLSSTAIADPDLEALEWLIDNGVTERIDPVDSKDEVEAAGEGTPQAEFADEINEDELELEIADATKA